MSYTYAEIVLENLKDVNKVLAGTLKKEEVRSIKVEVLVDTGAGTLIIDDDVQKKLGLKIESMSEAITAGNHKVSCGITEPITVRWRNRECECKAVVLPGQQQPLLGAFPLEEMNLAVHPSSENLIAAQGDEPVLLVMSADESCGGVQGEGV